MALVCFHTVISCLGIKLDGIRYGSWPATFSALKIVQLEEMILWALTVETRLWRT